MKARLTMTALALLAGGPALAQQVSMIRIGVIIAMWMLGLAVIPGKSGS